MQPQCIFRSPSFLNIIPLTPPFDSSFWPTNHLSLRRLKVEGQTRRFIYYGLAILNSPSSAAFVAFVNRIPPCPHPRPRQQSRERVMPVSPSCCLSQVQAYKTNFYRRDCRSSEKSQVHWRRHKTLQELHVIRPVVHIQCYPSEEYVTYVTSP